MPARGPLRRCGNSNRRGYRSDDVAPVSDPDLSATGQVDGAAVDSNALAVLRRREPSLASRVRILESWGPHPIQPIAVSSRLPSALADRIAASLCSMHLDEHSAKVLHSFGVLLFAPVADEEYAGERAALRSWQSEQQAARLSTKPTPVCGDLSARRKRSPGRGPGNPLRPRGIPEVCRHPWRCLPRSSCTRRAPRT